LQKKRSSSKLNPPRTQAARREATSRAILDAAETLFSRHGRDGVTIKAVAKEVGVNTALIHYYYDDLEKMFLAVWNRRAAIVNPLLRRCLPPTHPPSALSPAAADGRRYRGSACVLPNATRPGEMVGINGGSHLSSAESSDVIFVSTYRS